MYQSVRNTKVFKFFVILGRLGIYIMPIYIIGFILMVWIKSNFISPLDSKSSENIKFSIKAGETIEQIGRNLETAKIINSYKGFKWFAEKKKATFQVGEYELSANKKPSEIVDILLGGATINYELRITACQTLEEVVKQISSLELASEKELLLAFKNPRLMTDLGIPAFIPEGYLSEGVYTFNKPITPEQIVTKIIKESESRLEANISGWQDRASQLGYRPYEIIVIASIVEKESSTDPGQMSKISAVYHNRLKIGMQLQSEETLLYGVPSIASASAINDNDKMEETPYNTFTNIGLPPTPICSPSISALKAALYPSESEALYFLKNKNGSFDYSISFKEHQSKIDAQNKER